MSINKISRKRGKPREFDKDITYNVLETYNKIIITEEGKVLAKSRPEWNEIITKLNDTYKESNIDAIRKTQSLYSYVTCNKDNVRTKLSLARGIQVCDKNKDIEHDEIGGNESLVDDLYMLQESAILEESLESVSDNVFECDIFLPYNEFEKLLVINYEWTQKKKYVRKVVKLKQGEWQEFLNKKIIEKTKIKCGFKFQRHNVTVDGSSGHAFGYCDCKSEIESTFEREDDVMKIHCRINEGSGRCGKRPARAGVRDRLGTILQNKSAHVVRVEMANELMPNGGKEPGVLYSKNVLRQIRSQAIAKNHVHEDPLLALYWHSVTDMKDDIVNMSLKPFYVHYFTKHQTTVYKTLQQKKHICMAIDATGSICRRINLPNNGKSGPIFLYAAVISTSDGDHTSVAQMISDRHTTRVIAHWLSEWSLQSGVEPPKEVVCDASEALLAATIKTFTPFKTINQYADSFLSDELPPCYVRIDVAHHIKKYVDILKTARVEVKKFYLACIGKLIRCTSLDEADKLIYAIFVISSSESDGVQEKNENLLSECQEQKDFIASILHEFDYKSLVQPESSDSSGSDLEDDVELNRKKTKSKAEPSTFRDRGKKIFAKAEKNIKVNKGIGINPHWFPKVSTQLLDDLKWLALWSCVFLLKIGYGRNPASSGHVEVEFKNIKTILLPNQKISIPTRVDTFVEIHREYIDGKSKILSAKLLSEDADKEDMNQSNIERNTDASQKCKVDQSASNSCIACKMGNLPEGAHYCVMCKTAVHALDGCSMPYESDDEGYGQKRICYSCNNKNVKGKLDDNEKVWHNTNDCETCGPVSVKCLVCLVCQRIIKCNVCSAIKVDDSKKGTSESWMCIDCSQQSNVHELIESKKFDNWKNQVYKSNEENRGRYLQENYPQNAFLLKDKLSKVPILKAGSDTNLQAVSINKIKINLKNTNAFDMLFQMLLTISLDSDIVCDYLSRYNDENNFIKLIQEATKSGISLKTYRKRVEILLSYAQKGDLQFDCQVLDCNIDAGYLWKELVDNVPYGLKRTEKCDAGCEEVVSQLNFPLLEIAVLKDKNFNENLNRIIFENDKCSVKNCDGNLEGSVTTGKLLLLYCEK
ncbi:unnamed protein product [Parnassius mnemosyne]|uniref:SCAN domain-containing protein n=1 Tax=Parnassius mnemosyne TaxID=213953 RepID=A0AAV1LF22_9NEOP